MNNKKTIRKMLLVLPLQTVVCEQQEKDTRNVSCFIDKYAVQSAVARETDKKTVTFYITDSTLGGVLKL